MSCHHRILGVLPGATFDNIKTAYKQIALASHPDKTQHLDISDAERTKREELFKQANNAWQYFSEIEQRRQAPFILAPQPSQTPVKKRKYDTTPPPPPPRTPQNSLPRRSNSMNVDMYGWRFTMDVSRKWFVVGDWMDQTPKKEHASSMTIAITLEANQQSVYRAGEDIRIDVSATPSGKDVHALSSIHKYEIDKRWVMEGGMRCLREFECHQTLIITLQAPKSIKADLPATWNLAFNFTSPVAIPGQAKFVATHTTFQKTAPLAKLRTQKIGVEFEKGAPETKLSEIEQLKPFEVLKLGGHYYMELFYGGRKWYRLIAVGVRTAEREADQSAASKGEEWAGSKRSRYS